MATRKRIVHGDDLLYRFLMDLLEQAPDPVEIASSMLAEMAVWLPLDVYASWPILLPWVVRDPRCRSSGPNGSDEWSSPDERGYLRDDNSLIKSLPRALPIVAARAKHLDGARMGTEFVAAHVWRHGVGLDALASRVPELNSFVPNLVWVPKQIAKLTDREGGIVQRTLQSMAWTIYRREAVVPHLQGVTEQSWALLPEPEIQLEPSCVRHLNWFRSTPGFFRVRERRLRSVINALCDLETGRQLPERVVTRRYGSGLPSVTAIARRELLQRLQQFLPAAAA